jgi:hypothetical protein
MNDRFSIANYKLPIINGQPRIYSSHHNLSQPFRVLA